MREIGDIDDPAVARVLTHAVRVGLVAALGERPATALELARALGVTASTAAHHLRTLEHAGLVRRLPGAEAEAEAGPGEVRYALPHLHRMPDEVWVQLPPILRRAHAAILVEQLAGRALASNDEGGFERAGARMARHQLELDDAGWDAVVAALARLDRELEAIEARAAELGGARVRVDLVQLLFEAVPMLPPAEAPGRHVPSWGTPG